jgi:hypothetical protein
MHASATLACGLLLLDVLRRDQISTLNNNEVLSFDIMMRHVMLLVFAFSLADAYIRHIMMCPIWYHTTMAACMHARRNVVVRPNEL